MWLADLKELCSFPVCQQVLQLHYEQTPFGKNKYSANNKYNSIIKFNIHNKLSPCLKQSIFRVPHFFPTITVIFTSVD